MKSSVRSSRRRKRETYRKMHGNPWDSSSSSRRSKTISLRKTSRKSNKKSVTFREPIVRTRSSTKSSAHAAWHSVSSEK